MMRVLLLSLILLIPVTACAEQENAKPNETEKVFNAESFTLENGLDIVVIPNHRAPVVTHMVWYKTGAADELPGKSGIAHFLEHLLFKGSEGLEPGEFSEIVRSLGGNDNAFTSQDYTAYFQSIAAEHLETVMKMESGRMRGLNPPQEQVDSERLVILEERRQRTDNSPQARFGEQLNNALFPHHPYGIPIIGWAHEMEQLSWEDAKQFYDHWYGPNNAILIVSGDVTGEQVLSLAKKYYGRLKPINVPERTRTISPPLPADQIIRLYDKTVREPQVQILFRLPSFNQNREEALALQILEDILSGGSTARLYKSLVAEQKIATGASFGYSGSAINEGYGFLYATPNGDASLESLAEALDDQLRLIIKNGVTEQELTDSVARMQNAAIYARDSLTGPAMVFGRALTTGSSIDDIEYWPRQLETITAEDIRAVTTKYLNPDETDNRPRITGYLLPKE